MGMPKNLLKSSSTSHRLLAKLLHQVAGGIVPSRSYPPHRQVEYHSGGSTPEA
jgi:hypothetical protein